LSPNSPPSYLSIPALQGAYFFTRSVLMTIRTLEGKEKSVFDAEWKGWVLAAFFFLDAWLLGTCMWEDMGREPEKNAKTLLASLEFLFTCPPMLRPCSSENGIWLSLRRNQSSGCAYHCACPQMLQHGAPDQGHCKRGRLVCCYSH